MEKLNVHARDFQRSQHSHSRINNFQDFVVGLAVAELLANCDTDLNLGLILSKHFAKPE